MTLHLVTRVFVSEAQEKLVGQFVDYFALKIIIANHLNYPKCDNARFKTNTYCSTYEKSQVLCLAEFVILYLYLYVIQFHNKLIFPFMERSRLSDLPFCRSRGEMFSFTSVQCVFFLLSFHVCSVSGIKDQLGVGLPLSVKR